MRSSTKLSSSGLLICLTMSAGDSPESLAHFGPSTSIFNMVATACLHMPPKLYGHVHSACKSPFLWYMVTRYGRLPWTLAQYLSPSVSITPTALSYRYFLPFRNDAGVESDLTVCSENIGRDICSSLTFLIWLKDAEPVRYPPLRVLEYCARSHWSGCVTSPITPLNCAFNY
jgi:hypothetical protein